MVSGFISILFLRKKDESRDGDFKAVVITSYSIHYTKLYEDFLVDAPRINRRMHNKSLTADNQATIFGGRNIGDEYFDATEEVGFSDLDVLAIGPVVTDVSQAFDLYWNSQWVYPLAALVKDRPVATDQILV